MSGHSVGEDDAKQLHGAERMMKVGAAEAHRVARTEEIGSATFNQRFRLEPSKESGNPFWHDHRRRSQNDR